MEALVCAASRPSPQLEAVAVFRPAGTPGLFTSSRAQARCTRSGRALASMYRGRCHFSLRMPATRISLRSGTCCTPARATSAAVPPMACGRSRWTHRTKTVSSWKTNGGSPVGNLAFTASGRILVAVGPGTPGAGGYANAIVALDSRTLQPTDWFSSAAVEFVTTPVVISVSRSRNRRHRDARRAHLPPRRHCARWRQSRDAALLVGIGRRQRRARCTCGIRAACGHTVAARAHRARHRRVQDRAGRRQGLASNGLDVT